MRVREVVTATVFMAAAFMLPRFVFAGVTENVSGWAWSASAGWMSLNSTNCTALNAQQPGDPPCSAGYSYGVQVSETGYLTGFAWSRTLGWICVGASCAGTSGAVPVGGWRARVNALTGEAVGWAKIYSGGDSGWISFSCENTRTCGVIAYRTTLDVATGQFSGHAWNGARASDGVVLPAIGWIAWRPSYGGISTTWRPEPRCSETGRSCRTHFECELPGELCCLGGAPCGRCGGAGAECGLSAACNAGTICCPSGVTCGRCVTDGRSCGSNAECVGGGRDSCCPPGALCTRDIDARGAGPGGG
ncbi:hypothetical protein HY632_02240, partial [Candidatus Uhrbacteria bacterium]|nr:hypothetical protein [Candidatus Uhrbacteria bacterium]